MDSATFSMNPYFYTIKPACSTPCQNIYMHKYSHNIQGFELSQPMPHEMP